jgi:hypothetical protein
MDITVNEVVLDCMNRFTKQAASRTGVSTVMKLLSRKTMAQKAATTPISSAATAGPSSAVLHLTHGLGATLAHAQHANAQPPPEGATALGRRPSLLQRNGFKAPVLTDTKPTPTPAPALSTTEFKYDPTDSSHSSDSSMSESESEIDDEKPLEPEEEEMSRDMKYRSV